MAHGDRRIVYILRSITNPSRHYVGIAADLVSRLDWHNHGPCGYTVHHRPWEVVVSMHFPDEQAARRFERYLNLRQAERLRSGISECRQELRSRLTLMTGTASRDNGATCRPAI